MNKRADIPELSDLIVSYDVETLLRREVSKTAVLAQLKALDQVQGMRVVASLPANEMGNLDPDAVDGVLIRGHREIQRLNEEFQIGNRVLEVLNPMITALRAVHPDSPIRIVDVGCGLGYLIRWLAAKGGLESGVELYGCDFNTALIAESRRLAALESLPCEFCVGNAFRLADSESRGPTVFLSTGVLHHFRGQGLVEFFRSQQAAAAFFHFDIDPSWLAPLGARLFHWARMREPLARHDGVRSALRAHSGDALTNAARQGSPGHRVGLFRVGSRIVPITRNIRPVIGVSPPLWDAWKEGLRGGAKLIREASC